MIDQNAEPDRADDPKDHLGFELGQRNIELLVGHDKKPYFEAVKKATAFLLNSLCRSADLSASRLCVPACASVGRRTKAPTTYRLRP